MDADRTELHDLASQHPEKLEEMVRQWQSWAKRVGVQPWLTKISDAKGIGSGFRFPIACRVCLVTFSQFVSVGAAGVSIQY